MTEATISVFAVKLCTGAAVGVGAREDGNDAGSEVEAEMTSEVPSQMSLGVVSSSGVVGVTADVGAFNGEGAGAAGSAGSARVAGNTGGAGGAASDTVFDGIGIDTFFFFFVGADKDAGSTGSAGFASPFISLISLDSTAGAAVGAADNTFLQS
jgi:hypothetical protein